MKDPAVLFYTQDFITGTMLMTHEQRGKYIMLLCLQHQKGMLTKKDMLKICETYDKDIFDKFKQNGEGYYNERMRFESIKRHNFIQSRRKNRSLDKSDVEDMLKICETYDNHMSIHMENDNNISTNINVISIYSGKNFEERKKIFIEELAKFKERYDKDLLNDFYRYWSEKTKKGDKMKWETQKTWELVKRLVTWEHNQENFKRK